MDFGNLYKEFKSNSISKEVPEKVLIIDGLNMFIRNFSCNPTTNENGIHIGGMTGTLLSIAKEIRTFKPTRCILVFDGYGGNARRRKLYPEYKNRDFVRDRLNRIYDFQSSPENETEALSRQLVRLIEYIETLPITVIAINHIEADDTISVLRNHILKTIPGSEIVIVSTDKDFLQLVNEQVLVYSPTKKKVFDVNAVISEFGVIPENVVTIRTIEGDSSDNIPGVKGIGKKTLQKSYPKLFGNGVYTIDDLHEDAKSNVESGRPFKLIFENKEQIELNYKLMQLDCVDISSSTKLDIRAKYDEEIPTLDQFRFKQLAIADRAWSAFPDIGRWMANSFSQLNTRSNRTEPKEG